jgi:hypothetical protein
MESMVRPSDRSRSVLCPSTFERQSVPLAPGGSQSAPKVSPKAIATSPGFDSQVMPRSVPSTCQRLSVRLIDPCPVSCATSLVDPTSGGCGACDCGATSTGGDTGSGAGGTSGFGPGIGIGMGSMSGVIENRGTDEPSEPDEDESDEEDPDDAEPDDPGSSSAGSGAESVRSGQGSAQGSVGSGSCGTRV